MKAQYYYKTFQTGTHGPYTVELETAKRIFNLYRDQLQWFAVKLEDGRQYWYTERDGWKDETPRKKPARTRTSARGKSK